MLGVEASDYGIGNPVTQWCPRPKSVGEECATVVVRGRGRVAPERGSPFTKPSAGVAAAARGREKTQGQPADLKGARRGTRASPAFPGPPGRALGGSRGRAIDVP